MKRSATAEHEILRSAALFTLRKYGIVTAAIVSKEQGLCELQARLALSQLVTSGQASKEGRWYCLTVSRPAQS